MIRRQPRSPLSSSSAASDVYKRQYVYYMAEALLDTVLGKLADEEAGTPAYKVLETFKGKELEYKEYEPLYDCAAKVAEKQHKKAFYVTCDGYVTLTDGTGIVHIAPAFGEDLSLIHI